VSSYLARKEYAQFKLTEAILECRTLLSDIAKQREVEMQDDWDDALMVAYYKTDEATIYLTEALRALKEGA
jgi:hypothetical protein